MANWIAKRISRWIGSKKAWVFVFGGIALGALFAFLLWGAGPADFARDLPPCFETGAPFHHRYQPLCQTTVRSPQGNLEFQTNEDGLRDLPRDLILRIPNRVLLLGGGTVEGYWLREDQTLSSRLREMEPTRFFVNGGLKGAGPLFQAARLPTLIATYHPQEIWLNADDRNLDDDRLACAVEAKGSPASGAPVFTSADQTLPIWQSWILKAFGEGRKGNKLRSEFEKARRREFVAKGESCDPCEGYRRIQEIATSAKVRLRVLVLDLGGRAAFTSGGVEPKAIETIETCLEDLQIPFFTQHVNDLSAEDQDKYFWASQAYWNSLGAEYWSQTVHDAGDNAD